MNNLRAFYGVFESKGCGEYKKNDEKGFVSSKVEKINTESKNSLSCNDREREG